MKKIILSTLFGVWPVFFGVLLPYVSFPGGLRLLNIPWSIANGLGLWAVDMSIGLSVQSRVMIVGAFAWPIVVALAVAVLGARLFDMSFKTRLAVISLMLASSLVTVSLSSAQHEPVAKYPTYYRLFFAAW